MKTKPKFPVAEIKACRTCKLLSVPPDADGKVRIRKSEAYRCGYVFPPLESLQLPESTKLSGVFWYGLGWPPETMYMRPDAGLNCPQHTPKQKGPS